MDSRLRGNDGIRTLFDARLIEIMQESMTYALQQNLPLSTTNPLWLPAFAGMTAYAPYLMLGSLRLYRNP